MLGAYAVYTAFVAICFTALARPWIGIVGFYCFVLLEPNWNWRWSIPEDFQFQKFIAIFTFLGLVLKGFRGNRLTSSGRLSVFLLLGFLGIAFLSATQSISPETSDFYMGNLWKIVLMAIIAALLIDTPQKLWILLVVFALSEGYSAYRINEQYFEYGYTLYVNRPWGFKGDGNLFSNLTVPLVFCSASACVFADRVWLRALFGGVFLLQVHQLMLLESRGAMLAAMAALPLFGWYMPKNRFTITAAVVAIIAGSALAGPPVVKEFMSAFETDEKRDSSAQSRFELWRVGWAITKDNPVLGVGPYAGQQLVALYLSGGEQQGQKGLHNLFFEISTGCGLPATILYFGFFIVPWYVSWKTYRKTKGELDPRLQACLLAVVVGIPAYLAASMFSSGALLESPYAMSSMAIAAQSVIVNTRAKDGMENDDQVTEEDEIDD